MSLRVQFILYSIFIAVVSVHSNPSQTKEQNSMPASTEIINNQ